MLRLLIVKLVCLSRVAGVIMIGLCKFASCMSVTVINKNSISSLCHVVRGTR